MSTNVTAQFSYVAKKYATKTALIESEKDISYGELWDAIEKLSSGFHEIGVRENHRVALILPNCKEFIYCFFALLKINAIVSPLSSNLTPFELKSIFNNLNPHAIISSSKFIDKVYREYPALLYDKTFVFHGSVTSEKQTRNCYELNKLLCSSKNSVIENIETNDEHVATINYTYRGFGYPLGAVFSHKTYTEGILAYIRGTKMSSRERVLSLLPLHHFYPLVGCVIAPLVSGATVIMSKNYMPRSILKTIDDFRVNNFTVVPSIYKLLLRNYRTGEYDLSSLTCCITGGAYMSRDVVEAIKNKMGLEVLQGYGLTECFVASWNRYGQNEPGTLGLPFISDMQIRIFGDDDKPKKTNEIGEIVIKTPTVMQSYYNQKGETEKAIKGGWFYTGDYGCLDENQYLHFAGLKKEVAKVGGNMVDFNEVKNVLLSHSSISGASIYSEEDDLLGHIIAAEVAFNANKELTEKEIKTYCNKRLSHYKVPKTVTFRTEVTKR